MGGSQSVNRAVFNFRSPPRLNETLTHARPKPTATTRLLTTVKSHEYATRSGPKVGQTCGPDPQQTCVKTPKCRRRPTRGRSSMSEACTPQRAEKQRLPRWPARGPAPSRRQPSQLDAGRRRASSQGAAMTESWCQASRTHARSAQVPRACPDVR